MSDELIYGVIYSEFDDVMGPIAKFYFPLSISNKKLGSTVASKTIDIYDRVDLDNQGSLSVIPFPSENKKGLSKCIVWRDENKRGNTGMGAITILFDEKNDLIFYKYMKDIEILFEDVIEKIIELKNKEANLDDLFTEVKQFHKDTQEKLNELHTQELGVQDCEAFPDEKSEKILEKYQFKIVICGDPACGKTSTVLRFTDKAFRATYLPTLGTNITEKVVTIDNITLNLVLWDLAGQIKFQVLRSQFYSGAKAVVLLFDLTRQNTFENITKWHQDLLTHLGKEGDFITVLCGNKNDLTDDRVISREEGEKIAKQLNMEYFETSALTGENIDEAFTNLSKKLISNYILNKKRNH